MNMDVGFVQRKLPSTVQFRYSPNNSVPQDFLRGIRTITTNKRERTTPIVTIPNTEKPGSKLRKVLSIGYGLDLTNLVIKPDGTVPKIVTTGELIEGPPDKNSPTSSGIVRELKITSDNGFQELGSVKIEPPAEYLMNKKTGDATLTFEEGTQLTQYLNRMPSSGLTTERYQTK